MARWKRSSETLNLYRRYFSLITTVCLLHYFRLRSNIIVDFSRRNYRQKESDKKLWSQWKLVEIKGNCTKSGHLTASWKCAKKRPSYYKCLHS